jgi:hypothetical protein
MQEIIGYIKDVPQIKDNGTQAIRALAGKTVRIMPEFYYLSKYGEIERVVVEPLDYTNGSAKPISIPLRFIEADERTWQIIETTIKEDIKNKKISFVEKTIFL